MPTHIVQAWSTLVTISKLVWINDVQVAKRHFYVGWKWLKKIDSKEMHVKTIFYGYKMAIVCSALAS